MYPQCRSKHYTVNEEEKEDGGLPYFGNGMYGYPGCMLPWQ